VGVVLELVRRYFRLIDLNRRIRQSFNAYGLGGDYGGGRLVLSVITLFVAGARRLEHLLYVAHDPLVARLCGLARIHTERTVVHWLKQFTQEALKAIISLNSELLYEQVERLGLSRLTIDVDGTVICTCGKVAYTLRSMRTLRFLLIARTGRFPHRWPASPMNDLQSHNPNTL